MESIATYILILTATGVLVGLTTGLLGIGGGFLIVPILYFLLLSQGVDPTTAIRIAFGTSLAIIIPTAISSSVGHYRKNQVEVKAALYMGSTGFVGAILGGYVATHTPGDILRILFAFALLMVAVRMFFFKETGSNRNRKDNLLFILIIGFTAGIMSGLVGVGGGVIIVPAMVFLLGYTMKIAGGTSSAVIILTSLGGITAYIVNGIGVSGLPAYSLGYVNLLQFLVIVIFSIPLAQLGSYLSNRVPEKILRYIFVIMLIFISLQMLGIFRWLGIPI
ncbi:MAG TPA: sulfite exporter TauE/SafE family protein [Methanobacterium sp.]|nr:sulfite exporter TauE/SafE family protein [Methanobacterium sp.]